MSHWKNRNKEMSLEEWYDDYLMEYVKIIAKPKLLGRKHDKYNEKLLEWYDNWNGEMVEVTEKNK